MRAFITGGSGFLGRFLSESLVKDGYEIVAIDSKTCDLRDYRHLARFQDIKFEEIYHLAAWTQAGDFCLHHPGEQWLNNQLIHTHVLKWWHEHQPQAKMIAIGTSCGYDPHLPLIEENYLSGIPHESLFAYAMSKRMLLTGLEALHRQFGYSYLYPIPSTLYGPEYHTDGRQMHFIFDLMHKILRGALYEDSVTLWGDGWQRREVMHVDDFVKALKRLNAHSATGVINIASEEDHSIRFFAELICKEVGFSFEKIAFDLSRYVGAKSKKLSIDKLRTMLPDFSPVSLETGIRETLAWMRRTLFSP